MQKSGAKTPSRRRKDKVFDIFRPRKGWRSINLILLYSSHRKKKGERAFRVLRDVCPFSVQKKKKIVTRERTHDKSSCGFSNAPSGRDGRVLSARPLLLFLLGTRRRTEDGMEQELKVF